MWVENSFFIISKWQVTRVNCAKSPATNTSHSMEEWCWWSKTVKSTFFMVQNFAFCAQWNLMVFHSKIVFYSLFLAYFIFGSADLCQLKCFLLNLSVERNSDWHDDIFCGRKRGVQEGRNVVFGKQNSVIIIKKNQINYLQQIYCLNTKWYGNTRRWCA